MGTEIRAKQIAREIGIDDERQLLALENNDTALYFTIALYNIFSKCGNCVWRMKCGTGLLDRILTERLPDKDVESEAFTSGLLKMFDYLQERLTPEDFQNLIGIFLEETGMELEDMVDYMDAMFGKCITHAFIPGISNEKGEKK